jgi:hypothetical protein
MLVGEAVSTHVLDHHVDSIDTLGQQINQVGIPGQDSHEISDNVIGTSARMIHGSVHGWSSE